jgi:hypothetical protein
MRRKSVRTLGSSCEIGCPRIYTGIEDKVAKDQ